MASRSAKDYRKNNTSNSVSSRSAKYYRTNEEDLKEFYDSFQAIVDNWSKARDDYFKETENYYTNRDLSVYGLDNSKGWKDTVSSKHTWLENEALRINSILDEYGDYFDPDAKSKLKTAFADSLTASRDVLKQASSDIGFWNEFKDEGEYQNYYFSNKYNGKSYTDVLKAIETADGNEKDWLTNNSQYFMSSKEAQAEIDKLSEYKSGYSAIETELSNLVNQLTNAYRRAGYGSKVEQMVESNSRVAKLREQLKGYDKNGTENRIAELTEIKGQATLKENNKVLEDEAKSDKEFGSYVALGESKGMEKEWDFYVSAAGGIPMPERTYSDKIVASRNGEYVSDGDAKDLARQMTDEQYNNYLYFLGKYGKKKAQEYLDTIEYELNTKSALEIQKSLEGTVILPQLFGFYAGVDSYWDNLEGIFSDGYKAPSSTQIASGLVREDQGWFGKVTYDLANTTGHMTPSILGSMAATALLGPAGLGVAGATTAGSIGQGVGAGLVGLSAMGGAKQEMLNLGYSNAQATTYGILTGASEACLQYALGGIGKLGGAWTDDAVKALTKGINKAGAKFAIEFGADMASEALEESLQEVLNPFFKKIATGKNEGVDWAQVGYNGLLGALSAGLLNGLGSAGTRVGEVSLAKQIKKDGNIGKLKEIGNTFSADTLAYKLASKVDENTGAWKLADLIHEMHGTLSEQNVADIKYELVRNGMVESDAESIAGWLAKAVDGDNFTATQRKALDNNPIISRVFKKVIIDKNSTVNQRLQAMMDLEGTVGQAGVDYSAIYKSQSKEGLTASANFHQALKSAQTDAIKQRFGIGRTALGDTDATIDSMVADTKKAMSKGKVSESGVTTDSTTGKQIDIKKVKSNDGTQMTYELANGSVIDSKNVEYANDDEGILHEHMLEMGYDADIANAIINGRSAVSDMPMVRYLNGMDEAIEYGRIGYPMDKISSNGFYAELPDSMKTYAYNLGKDSAKKATETAQAKVDANKGKVEQARKGAVVKLYEKSGLTPRQEASIETLGKVVSDITHNKVYIFDTIEKTINGKKVRVFANDTADFKAGDLADNGFINKATGEIYIDLYAGTSGEGVILWTLAHELTHFVRLWSPAKFNVLADFLVAEYGKQGTDVRNLVLEKMANTKRKKLSYDEAFEEVVADSMQTMFTDTNLAYKLEKLKNKDKGLWNKIKAFFRDLYKRIQGEYKDVDAQTKEAYNVRKMSLATIERLSDLFAEGIVDAGETYANLDLDGIANSMPSESTATTDPNSMVAHSYRSFAEACGFDAFEDPDTSIRSWRFKGSINQVGEITEHQIRNSPIGALINYSATRGYISYEDAKAQYKMFADIGNMCIKQQDFAQAMQFVGSMVFTGMKANADKQYKTTYDFPSICTKTQAVINAMSDAMIKKGAGLTKAEIEALYRKVWEMGNPVPCPECYVFSRWVGIGGLLDNIKRYQDTYSKMTMEEVEAEYQKMSAEIKRYSEENDISFGKAKGKIFDLYAKEEAKLMDEIAKLEEAGDPVPQSKRDRLAKISLQKETTKAMSWIHKVYFANESHTKVNPKYLVPNEVLFDLNAGETFATEYKEAWGFRTTQGAGYGKAITPYAEAVLGEGIKATNNTTKTIKGKANRDTSSPQSNIFLEQNGTLNTEAIRILETARKKQLAQAFLGGQRLQSTSDARYENVTDYLIAAIEMQAMHSKAQVYTKVSGAVEAFNTWGFAINQSLMPLNSGLTKDGRLKDTSSGGMKVDVAYANRARFENAGTITIGVNDAHIRTLIRDKGRDFVIPYHASGGDQSLIREFRRIQDSKSAKETFVQSCDYSKTQAEKELPTSLLRELGYTDERVADVEKFREQRLAILTRNKAVDMEYIRADGNEVLSRLYDEFNGGIWDGVKLTKDTVGTSIFPNEYWDKSVDYDHSSKITEDYLEYCRRLGFLHKFSGKSIQYNKNLQKHQFIDVMGYNENGERVALTDLAYIDGDPSKGVEQFYWKTLTDRRMYGNDGKYLEQKFVTLGNADSSVAKTFAKDNEGSVREFSQEKSDETLKTIKVENGKVSVADNFMLSERNIVASDFVTHMKDIVKDTGGWYAKDVFGYVEAHPELNYIERIYEGDKKAKKDLEAFLNTIDDTKVLENLSWFMCQAYGDKGRTWSWDEGAKYPYRGATRTFQNAVKKRINAIMTEKVGGTNLGIKNGEVSLQDTKAIYDKLNGIEEFKPLAEKVFATAEKLGVNIRFANQVLSSKKVAGDNLGDMVEYKTSYFNDTAYTDQHKANTILHELIHVCTVYVMNEDSKYNFMGEYGKISGKSAEYVKLRNAGTRLNQIFDQIQRDPDFKGQYGLTNSKEMVAELANENFVGLLKKKNLWDRIIEAIADIFGFVKGKTAYDGAMQCLNYILDNPDVSEYKAFVKEQRENARYNGMDVFGKTEYTDYSYSERTAQAVERFGTTSNFNEAGYCMADGRMLNMTRDRNVYHDQISAIYSDVSGREAVNRFIQEGNVRLIPVSAGIEIGQTPVTTNQLNVISRFVGNSLKTKGYFYLDITGKDGKNIASIDYDADASVSDVIYDIKDYYERGRIPSRNSWYSYSERSTNATDNRSLLANALETVAKNDVERSWLAKYKAQIESLNKDQNELSKIRAEIKKARFTQGADRSKLPALENKAKILADRINRADKKLLNLEVSKPLQGVIDRERAKAYQLGKAKVAEYREQRAVSSALNYYRPRMEKIVSDLQNRLEHPSAKTAIPEAFGASIAKALSAFNFTTYDKDGNPRPTKANMSRENAREALKELSKQLGQNTIESQYGQLDIPAEMLEWVESVRDYFDSAVYRVEQAGELAINKMDAEQLKTTYKFLRSLQTAINKAGKYYTNASYNVADDARSTMDYVGQLPKEVNKTVQKATKVFKWDFASPVTVFDRFGEGGKRVYNMLVKGQSKMAYNSQMILDFVDNAYTEKEAREWRETLTTVAIGGKDYNVPVEMLMGLHCLLKQEDSRRHILEGGGIRFGDVEHKGKVTRFENVFFNEIDAMAVETALDAFPRAKEVADKMQKFMQEQGSSWGNEISMVRFGYHAFTKDLYYPIRTVAAGSEYEAQQKRANIYALLNKSFTKERTPGANNAVIVDGIFSVFNNHMSEMALYNAWALPVIDTIKWFNYKETQDIDAKTSEKSVHETFRLAYGNYADEYVRRLLESINSQADNGLSEEWAFLNLRKVNRVAVSWNARVVIQQPFSVTRAFELINPKYVTPLLGKAYTEAKEEMLANSGIAKWKSLGYYDADISKPMEGRVLKNETLVDKVSDVGMKGAEVADSLTWASLWNACKKETAEKNPGLEGKELLEKTTERFNDIVLRTQVVDSVLTKPQWLRSKGFWHKSTSAFMSEPLTSYNALLRQADKFSRDVSAHGSKYAVKNNAKAIVKATGIFLLTQVVNALATAPIDGLRDDDDYETYLEKVLASFKENALMNIIPTSLLPYVSDIVEYYMYGRTDRPDMSLWVGAIDLGKQTWNLFDPDKYSYHKLHKTFNSMLKVGSQVSGFPVANAFRDVLSVYNAVAGALGYGELKFQTDEDTHSEGYDRMYEAMLDGNEDRMDYLYGQLMSNGVDEDKIYNGLTKLVGEDVKSGEITDEEAAERLKEIIDYLGKTDADGNPITDTDIYWMIDEWKYAGENESTEEYSKYDDIFKAMEEGDPSSAIEEHVERLTEHYYEVAKAKADRNGTTFNEVKAEKEAESKAESAVKSGITAHWKPLYKEAYSTDNEDEMDRIIDMLHETGLYGSRRDVKNTVKGWLES